MRSSMMFFGVRLTSAPTRRRKAQGHSQRFDKMLTKLDAASSKLARSRPRR
jgi:hypothetical protein